MRDELKAEQCSKFLRAVGDPERLRIIQLLRARPMTVGDIAESIGQSFANTSHHLKQMRNAGLVSSTKTGRHVSYAMSPRFMPDSSSSTRIGVLEFGCCRIELGGKKSDLHAS